MSRALSVDGECDERGPMAPGRLGEVHAEEQQALKDSVGPGRRHKAPAMGNTGLGRASVLSTYWLQSEEVGARRAQADWSRTAASEHGDYISDRGKEGSEWWARGLVADEGRAVPRHWLELHRLGRGAERARVLIREAEGGDGRMEAGGGGERESRSPIHGGAEERMLTLLLLRWLAQGNEWRPRASLASSEECWGDVVDADSYQMQQVAGCRCTLLAELRAREMQSTGGRSPKPRAVVITPSCAPLRCSPSLHVVKSQ